MADTVGVAPSPPARAEGRPGGGLQKRKKMILAAGGAGALLLLLGHKNASANTAATDPNAQLQNQADALAAADANAATGMTNADGVPNVDSGGGNITGPGSGSPSITVNILPKPTATPGGKGKPGGKKPPKRKPPDTDKEGKGDVDHKGKTVPKPKEPPKGKPAAAKKDGKHPDTKRRTPSGTRKGSPAEVESVQGIGAGQVVMGRQFPGALGHRMGPPQRHTDGSMSRTVTIDYGGRTETHRVFGNGERWRDREPGFNPPSRGVPAVNNGHPV